MKETGTLYRVLKELARAGHQGFWKVCRGGNGGYYQKDVMCREDDLIDANRNFCDKLINAGADVAYTEEPGRHEWNFWDVHIRRVIEEWLPLERGNV